MCNYNRCQSTIVENLKFLWLLFHSIISIETIDNKLCLFLLSLHALLVTAKCGWEEAFKVLTLKWSHWNMKHFQTIGNIGNICHSAFKIFLWIPWIPYVIPKKSGVHMKFLSWIKNSSKTRNIAVKFCLTVLKSACFWP